MPLRDYIFGKKTNKYLDNQGRPKTIITTGSSKGLGGLGQTSRNESSLKNYWNYYESEGTIFASINTTAWNSVMVGYYLISDNEQAKLLIQQKLELMDIDTILLDNVIYGLIYGDSFIEKVRNGSGRLIQLKTVDPTTMQINIDEYGNITNYQQKISGKLYPPIEAADIIHLRFFPKPDSPYGVSIICPSKDTIDRKISTDESIANAVKRHGTPKYIITVGNEEEIPPEDVFTDIKSKLEDITSLNEFIVPGLVKINTIDESGIQSVKEYYDYFQTQLIVGLLCPEEALGQGKGILHPDTEIFVKGKGFIPISDVNENDIIMSYNKDKNCLEWQINKKTWEFDLEEDLYNIKAQTFNLLCTNDHRVLFRGQHKEDFEVCQAKELPTRFEMIVGGMNWIGEDLEFETIPPVPIKWGTKNYKNIIRKWTEEIKIPIDIWLEFLGYFISEGYTTIREGEIYEVGIRQYPGLIYDKILKCLEKFPFKFSAYEDRFVICNKQLSLYLQKFGKSEDRFIPEYIKNLPKERLSILYKALMDGDGSYNNYFTVSQKLANDIQEIILKLGFGSTIYKRDRMNDISKLNGIDIKHNFIEYTVTKNEFNLTPEICIKDTEGHKSMLQLIPYKGKAYCVTVDNGLILTRLNGKCVITGNSTEATSRVKEIMYERFIKAIQHKLTTLVRLDIINTILLENRLPENIVYMRFNSVTDADEAIKAKWLGNLLRGYPDLDKPFTVDEVRAIFDYPPKKEDQNKPTTQQPQTEPRQEKQAPKEPDQTQQMMKIMSRRLSDVEDDVESIKEEIDVNRTNKS